MSNPMNITKEQVIAEFREFEHKLAAFSNYKGRVYDLDDPAENKAARSDRLALGKVIAELDRKHSAIKAPLLEATRIVDGERKRLKDEFLAIQQHIKGQLDAYEQQERERVETLRGLVEDIREMVTDSLSLCSEGIAERLKSARAIVLDDSWQEFKAEAALARTETIDALESLLEERQKAEAQAAEQARLRAEAEAKARQEREEKIAREAAEKARTEAEAKMRAEAERVERERREAEEKAARDRERAKAEAAKAIADAEAKAARAAAEERARIEREQAERARKEAEARKAEEERKAKQKHRSKIHGEIKRDLITCGLDDALSTNVVEMIRDGKIAHVTICY